MPGVKRVDARFPQIDSRFDAMQQTCIRIGGGLIGVLFVALRRH